MTQEELNDHRAVRIKHMGPCPEEKGHADNDFGSGLFLGVLLTFIGCFMLALTLGLHR